MSPPPSNRAFKKIQAINRELDRSSLERIRLNRKKRQFLYSLIILFIVTAISAFAIVYRTDIINYFADDIRYEIKLLTAKSNDEGELKIVITTNFSEQAKFNNVKAYLFDQLGKQRESAEVMPVYLKKNRIDLHILKPEIFLLPGDCDLKIHLGGRNQTSNTIRILKLDRVGGRK